MSEKPEAMHFIEPTLLQPGRNCWRSESADRIAFLVDAKRYFETLDELLPRARRGITIVGWDFDSDMRLVPGGPGLGDLLLLLVEANPRLEIRVLVWRSSLVYANNHDIPHPLGGNWWDHPRIDYRLDAQHPLGGSHHQKIVSIDDRLAFVGGIDLTGGRWDDRGHVADRVERRTPDGEAYGPVHDVQMLVDGRAAAAIADLARERWQSATGETLQPAGDLPRLWPAGVRPDLRRHVVAIARTQPEYAGSAAAREIEQLNLDCLQGARTQVYLEAQYFALPEVADILCDHLRRPDGPEVVAVVNRNSHGLMEQYVMGQNRDRLFGQLLEADRHGRLALLFARTSCEQECDIKVHSKVVIVDDRFLRIGSSNLNQRSMGVDTECDLAIDAATPAARDAIRRFRRDLLADHLRTSPARVAQVYRANGNSLLRTLDRLRSGGCLAPYPPDACQAAPPVPLTGILDPAEPLSLSRVLSDIKP